MNSNLSILLRQPRRFLKIFSKTITSQTHTPRVPINIPVLNWRVPDLSFPNVPSDLVSISIFLCRGLERDSLDFDLMVPVVDRLTRRFKSVETIITELQSLGSIDYLNTTSESCLLLLRVFSHAGKHGMLIDAYHHMIQFLGFVPNTFASNLFMDSLFRTSQSNIALCVFKQMKSPDFTTFKTSLCHLSRLNDITNISHVLRLMLSIPHYPDESTFNEVLNSFCKTKDAMSPQVYQLWGLKVKLGIDFSDNFFTLLIYKYYKLQRFDEATKLFVEMLQTDCSDNAAIKSYTTLVRSSIASNNVDAALHLFNLMLSKGFKPYRCFYGGILVALDVPGREREVLELVSKVREIESTQMDNPGEIESRSKQMDNPMYL